MVDKGVLPFVVVEPFSVAGALWVTLPLYVQVLIKLFKVVNVWPIKPESKV